MAPKRPLPNLAIGSRGLILSDLDSLWRFAQYVSHSGLAPKGIQSPEAIFTAVQLGLELGLAPMQSLQCIAVINGRPSVYGDTALALVRDSGLLDGFSERYEGKEDNYACVCVSKRKGEQPLETRFSIADAKRAKLWGKAGPWTEYPQRMLKFRARGFNLRDNFGDVLRGLHTAEEVADTPIVVEAKPVAPPVGRQRIAKVAAQKPAVVDYYPEAVEGPPETITPENEIVGTDQAAEVPEPPPEIANDAAAMDHQDLLDGLANRIREADSIRALELVGVDMYKAKPHVGEMEYESILLLYQDRFKILNPHTKRASR